MPLIAVAGPPCSGKTTLAAELSRRLQLPYLSMDAVRARILPGAAHTRADRQVAYRAMHLAAGLMLGAGAGLILDAPYGHAEDREELVRTAGAALRLIECRVSEETAVRRFRLRGADPIRLDLTEDLVRSSARDYPYARTGLLLDTDVLSLEECCAAAVASLATARPAYRPPE